MIKLTISFHSSKRRTPQTLAVGYISNTISYLNKRLFIMIMRWIYSKVPDELIKNIQSELYTNELAEYEYELEPNPHITIVPGFKKEGKIETPKIEGSISVSGYRFYPSERKPMVVMLDVSQSQVLSDAREKSVKKIGKDNIEFELHPFHITIVKAGNAGDESDFSITKDVADKIVSKCKNHPSELTIKDTVIDSWGA